ncbi:MAG: penicillin-binding protein 1C [Pseudomonadota bacterium]
MPRWLAALSLAAFLIAMLAAGDRWIARTALPPLAPAASPVMLDRDGRLMRAWAVEDGIWQLPVTASDVDPDYIARLVAYEDKRFWRHAGVDPLALLRAAWQALRHGRVVSGGSTLTMQVARLLEASGTGRLAGKLRQIRVALALERRLDKRAILTLYLQLAPMGGNLEGVRAASLAYLGKEPRRLTPAEAALLIAIPQSPEARRPDRPTSERPASIAEAARNRVLARLAAAGALDPEDAAAARREAVPKTRRAFPRHAPHLADRLRAQHPLPVIRTTLDRDLQATLQRLAHAHARALSPEVTAAILVADHQTGAILAEIGSAEFLSTRRRGFLDMTRAQRSPGSLLKPFIYALAFEQGIAHPQTLVEDRPTRFGAWEPVNFDRRFRGTVSLAEALQLSLNIPAVALLEQIGPARLMALMRRARTRPALPPGGQPGLAIGLGGLGLSLQEAATLYAALAGGGVLAPLHATPAELAPRRVIDPLAAWYTADILAGLAPPRAAAFDRLAYKTGTSYGHRDAWAIGFDGQHVIAVWLGRADGTALPGILGAEVAAPLLFEAFSRLKPRPAPLAPPPDAALILPNAALPPPLRRLRPRGLPPEDPGLTIAFPPDGARLDLGLTRGRADPMLTVKLREGRPPFTWLLDGAPLAVPPYEREAVLTPDGPGYAAISVIDALGETARIRVFLE